MNSKQCRFEALLALTVPLSEVTVDLLKVGLLKVDLGLDYRI